jgi:hypothetical protein
MADATALMQSKADAEPSAGLRQFSRKSAVARPVIGQPTLPLHLRRDKAEGACMECINVLLKWLQCFLQAPSTINHKALYISKARWSYISLLHSFSFWICLLGTSCLQSLRSTPLDRPRVSKKSHHMRPMRYRTDWETPSKC